MVEVCDICQLPGFHATALACVEALLPLAIRWRDVRDELPDAGLIVLVACPFDNDPVWLGYLDGESCWYTADGTPIAVSHWSALPSPPPTAGRRGTGAGAALPAPPTETQE